MTKVTLDKRIIPSGQGKNIVNIRQRIGYVVYQEMFAKCCHVNLKTTFCDLRWSDSNLVKGRKSIVHSL